MMRIPNKVLIVALMLLTLFSNEVFACSVCFGSSDILVSRSLNAGIIALVGFVAVVLSSIAYTAYVWAQRAKRLSGR